MRRALLLIVCVSAAGAPAVPAAAAEAYRCLEQDTARHERAAHGLTLCTAELLGESLAEGILLPDRAALVTQVEPSSAAGREGLVPGDAIYRVTGEPVATAREAAGRIAEAGGGEVRVNFLRDRRPFLVRLWAD